MPPAGKRRRVSQKHCTTLLVPYRPVEFEWDINGTVASPSDLWEPGEALKSPIFTHTVQCTSVRFVVELYPSGEALATQCVEGERTGWGSLRVVGSFGVNVELGVRIETPEGNVVAVAERSIPVSANRIYHNSEEAVTWPNFIDPERIARMETGTRVVVCVGFSGSRQAADLSEDSLEPWFVAEQAAALSAAMGRVFESGSGADAKISVIDDDGDETASFPVHAGVLAERIPFFERAFSESFAEGRERVVRVVGSTPRAVKHILRWAYTGEVPDELRGTDEALETVSLADMYLLCSLVRALKSRVVAGLRVHSILSVITLARKYHLRDVEAACAAFAQARKTEFLSEHTWKELRRSDPAAALEIYMALFSSEP